ncbi:glycine betaine ABC transporter substrate-binding protein [Pseudarthrobacter sp. H2]|uniref:glycine betaine ABC transporter substrate-binding protein n=1 Tax=Pseudarthrobacter sp. H2 TaxID=3418415 RepID=UPI003CF7281A
MNIEYIQPEGRIVKIRKRFSRSGLVVTAAAFVLIASACGVVPSTNAKDFVGGSIKPISQLKDASLTVSSKEYDEQLVLSQIAITALQAAGANVKDKTGLQGTGTVRKALTSGQADLYWEYTGSAWFEILGQTETHPGRELYKKVSDMDLTTNKISWLAAAPMNDTYAVAVTKTFSEQTGIKSISDMAAYVEKNPAAGTMCVENEFLQRPDGLSGMKEKYGIQNIETKLMGVSVVYTQLAAGNTCNFGDIYSTDGRIVGLNLIPLQDDKEFFPSYNPAVTLRQETLQKYPEIKGLLDPIVAKLDDKTITALNAQAADGMKPRTIAVNWLKSNGFIG